MRKFKSQGQAHRFLSRHGVINNLFRLGRQFTKPSNYRLLRDSTQNNSACFYLNGHFVLNKLSKLNSRNINIQG
jgi:hypothetical protein